MGIVINIYINTRYKLKYFSEFIFFLPSYYIKIDYTRGLLIMLIIQR